MKKVRSALTQGNYDEAVNAAKEIALRTPPTTETEEALYLEGYSLLYGRSDFKGARAPLQQLVDNYPKGAYTPEAQKLIADSRYWQGHYHTAIKEYRKLGSNFTDKNLQNYAKLQIGNCLLLDDKVGDAINGYRNLTEKSSDELTATSAQLMIANTYLKLQNVSQAKTELQKLISFTHNKDVQLAAQKALRQLEEEEPFKKGVGVPE
jgi:TolA-binding protein